MLMRLMLKYAYLQSFISVRLILMKRLPLTFFSALIFNFQTSNVRQPANHFCSTPRHHLGIRIEKIIAFEERHQMAWGYLALRSFLHANVNRFCVGCRGQ